MDRGINPAVRATQEQSQYAGFSAAAKAQALAIDVSRAMGTIAVRIGCGAGAGWRPVARRSRSSLCRHRSGSERSRGIGHNCRCVRPANRLRIPGNSDNWRRTHIGPLSFPLHGVAVPCRRRSRRAAGFRSAGHAHSDTRCDHPARSRPAIAHHIRRRCELRVQRRGLVFPRLCKAFDRKPPAWAAVRRLSGRGRLSSSMAGVRVAVRSACSAFGPGRRRARPGGRYR